MRVDDVMHHDVETVGPDDDAVKAADILLAQKVGSLPVVDERHHLMGIVTESDFVSIAREAVPRAGKTHRPRWPWDRAGLAQSQLPQAERRAPR